MPSDPVRALWNRIRALSSVILSADEVRSGRHDCREGIWGGGGLRSRRPCAMPSDPIRDLWNRIRGLGRKVEEEVYEFTEEDELEEEPRGRNTIIALINAFLTMWKATQEIG